MKHLLTLFLFFILSAPLFSQGSISGKILDSKTNEVLIGANVSLTGTTLGSSTDIDGYYLIRNIKPGIYQLKVSYISYKNTIISEIKIDNEKEKQLNIFLEPATQQLEEIIVSAEATKNSEAGILKIQRNSSSIIDALSSELISKNNSSDGTDVLKRMSGITINDGKYAVIRGVGDRYNNTMLNGANVPSTDPEKESFSYDIIPASLIENVITSKTFS